MSYVITASRGDSVPWVAGVQLFVNMGELKGFVAFMILFYFKFGLQLFLFSSIVYHVKVHQSVCITTKNTIALNVVAIDANMVVIGFVAEIVEPEGVNTERTGSSASHAHRMQNVATTGALL